MNAHDWFQTRYGIRLPDGNMAMTMQGQPWMWENLEDAERAIGYFRINAEKLGVGPWHGEIVRQLATPWIGQADNADLMVQELSAWLERQVGGQP